MSSLHPWTLDTKNQLILEFKRTFGQNLPMFCWEFLRNFLRVWMNIYAICTNKQPNIMSLTPQQLPAMKHKNKQPFLSVLWAGLVSFCQVQSLFLFWNDPSCTRKCKEFQFTVSVRWYYYPLTLFFFYLPGAWHQGLKLISKLLYNCHK